MKEKHWLANFRGIAMFGVVSLCSALLLGCSDQRDAKTELPTPSAEQVPPILPTEQKVTVPVLVGMSAKEARKSLETANLLFSETKKEDSNVPAGQVLSQDPSAGESVNERHTVTLVVATFPCTSSKATNLQGPNYIFSTFGGKSDPAFGSYLSWDGRGKTKADATVEKADVVQWKFTEVGCDTYTITSLYGGEDHPLYGAYLSWDSGSPYPNVTVEKNDRVDWKVIPVANKPGYYKLASQYGGPSHKYFDRQISWNRANRSYPTAHLAKSESPVEWYISPDQIFRGH